MLKQLFASFTMLRHSAKKVAVLWLILSLICFGIGGSIIYRYSVPGVLWVVMTSIEKAFQELLIGSYALAIGLCLLRNQSKVVTILLSSSLIILLYILLDVFRFPWSIIPRLLDNFAFLVLSLSTIKITTLSPLHLSRQWTESRKIFFIILLSGLLPYLLPEFINYEHFRFLH